MKQSISAADAAAMIRDDAEVAFLDVREIVPFSTGHPLLATNVPLSRLELVIGDLVPRANTRIIVIDGGGNEAALAATRLETQGYSSVSVLDGGAPQWAAAGFGLVPEIEVPTKGFGAFARVYGQPNYISPSELNRALTSDEDWVVLDSRPRDEYRKGNIPGSIDAPGADLVRWFDDLVPDPTTNVVVNCMSATRGTLGGLSLMACQVPNPVHVLHHGTRGWLLDGFELEVGASRFLGPPTPAAVAAAKDRVAPLAASANIPIIDAATLAAWRNDRERTTYLFDVRSALEFAAGHLAGSRNAPEGSIVMSPDRFFATLGARIVLQDDDGVRATITALWLAQMGWGEIAVLCGDIIGSAPPVSQDSTSGARVRPPPAPAELRATLSASEVNGRRLNENVQILDVGHSDDYEAGHLPDAAWCSRVRLAEVLQRREPEVFTILTSPDGELASLARADLEPAVANSVGILSGGNQQWQASGFSLVADNPQYLSSRDDHFHASSERPGDTRQNVLNYLQWETDLLDDITRIGPVPYRNLLWR